MWRVIAETSSGATPAIPRSHATDRDVGSLKIPGQQYESCDCHGADKLPPFQLPGVKRRNAIIASHGKTKK